MKKIINYPSLLSIMYKYPRTKSSNSEKCNKRDTDLLLKQLSSVIVFWSCFNDPGAETKVESFPEAQGGGGGKLALSYSVNTLMRCYIYKQVGLLFFSNPVVVIYQSSTERTREKISAVHHDKSKENQLNPSEKWQGIRSEVVFFFFYYAIAHAQRYIKAWHRGSKDGSQWFWNKIK